jgi:hypothetical protein
MVWTQEQKRIAVAVLVVLVIAIAGYFGYQYWQKHKQTAAHAKMAPPPPRRYPRYPRAGFTGDLDHWPTAGTFGNLADTNPYGNYAGHRDMYYPTYDEGYVTDMYWTQT